MHCILMHWVGVWIPKGMVCTSCQKCILAMYFTSIQADLAQRYENLDALFMASASSPMRAIHRSISSLFSCLSFRDCASAMLSWSSRDIVSS